MRWFTEEEVLTMTTPVIKRMARAIRRGHVDEALDLGEPLAGERIVLHDFLAEAGTAAIGWIAGALGEERLPEAFEYVFLQSAKRQVFDLISMLADRSLEARMLARDCWIAHSCSGAGRHGGSFSIDEDDEKVTFTLDPCGSGGRMWRKGLCDSPSGLGVTSRAYPWSFGIEGLPLYCVHCAFLNELVPFRQIGSMTWPVDPPGSPDEVCRWHVYKDREAVPADYFRRVGLPDTVRRTESRVQGRWFTDDELRDMAWPTPERIRDALEKGDPKRALAVCGEMGGEFLFLHDLYVNALACALDFIAGTRGERALGDAIAGIYEKCVAPRLVPLFDGMSRPRAIELLVTDFFLAGTCGGSGHPPARVRIEEDTRELRVILDPCPSGGKLLRRRSFERAPAGRRVREKAENALIHPAARMRLPRRIMWPATLKVVDYIAETRKPEGLGVTLEAHDWAGGRAGLPYYCALCTGLLGMSGCEWLEVSPPSGRKDPCVWSARKN